MENRLREIKKERNIERIGGKKMCKTKDLIETEMTKKREFESVEKDEAK